MSAEKRKRLKRRLRELEQRMGKDGFWDDQRRSRETTREHAAILRELFRLEENGEGVTCG